MTTTYDATTIVDSLAAFGGLPDWLAAGMDPRRVSEGLERQVPELRDGRFRLLACTPDRLRAKGDAWLARYTLSRVRGARVALRARRPEAGPAAGDRRRGSARAAAAGRPGGGGPVARAGPP